MWSAAPTGAQHRPGRSPRRRGARQWGITARRPPEALGATARPFKGTVAAGTESRAAPLGAVLLALRRASRAACPLSPALSPSLSEMFQMTKQMGSFSAFSPKSTCWDPACQHPWVLLLPRLLASHSRLTHLCCSLSSSESSRTALSPTPRPSFYTPNAPHVPVCILIKVPT